MIKLTALPLVLLLVATLLLPGCAEGEASTNAAQGEPADSPAVAITQTPSPYSDPTTRDVTTASQAPTLDADPYPGLFPGLAPLAERFGRQRVGVILINDPPPGDPALLIQQLRQILPAAEVIEPLPNAPLNQLQIAIAPVNDLRALGNMIPFGQANVIDERARSITVEYQP